MSLKSEIIEKSNSSGLDFKAVFGFTLIVVSIFVMGSVLT